MEVKMDIKPATEDLKALAEMFKELPVTLVQTMQGQMLYEAAKPIVKHAKASNKWNDKSGRLRKSIKRIRRNVYINFKFVRQGAASAIWGGKGARQVHMIESGTKERFQKTTGRYTGRVQPGKVFETAFDLKQNESFESAIQAGKKEFNAFANAALRGTKLNRRQARALTQ